MAPPFSFFDDESSLDFGTGYEVPKFALYGEEETSPGPTHYYDFFSSYDDIARKLEARKSEAQQEYEDRLKAAMTPRRTGLGETLASALLAFGAPLIGKAVGGNQLGAQGAKLGLEGVAQLDKKIDEDYLMEQKRQAALAQAAREDEKATEKELLDLPQKKLALQSQLEVNRIQNEQTGIRQTALENLQFEHQRELERIRQEREGLRPHEVDAFINDRRREYETMGVPYTADTEVADRAALRVGGPQQFDSLRRKSQFEIQKQINFSYQRDGAEQTRALDDKDKGKLRDYQMKAARADLAAERLMEAIKSDNPNDIANAKAALIGAEKERQNAGAALTGGERIDLLGNIPELQPKTFTQMFSRGMQKYAYGVDDTKSLEGYRSLLKETTESQALVSGVKILDMNRFLGRDPDSPMAKEKMKLDLQRQLEDTRRQIELARAARQ